MFATIQKTRKWLGLGVALELLAAGITVYYCLLMEWTAQHLGHWPVPMIDDPKQIPVSGFYNDRLLQQLIHIQWIRGPLETYLLCLTFCIATFINTCFLLKGRTRSVLSTTLLVLLKSALLIVFLVVATRIMFWMED